jgi:hypothetical protein
MLNMSKGFIIYKVISELTQESDPIKDKRVKNVSLIIIVIDGDIQFQYKPNFDQNLSLRQQNKVIRTVTSINLVQNIFFRF